MTGFWFPPTSFVEQLSSNGRNNAFRIRIKRGPYQAAVYAQELFEFGYKWRRLHVFLNKREMELMSHEIEVQAAVLFYGVDEVQYRRREAGGMPAYPWLKGLSPVVIEQEMLDRSVAAREWVQKRRAKIKRAVSA